MEPIDDDASPLALEPLMTRPRERPVPRPWSLRLWELAVTSLPLLLMALLAGATFWLVRNTPVPPEARPERSLGHVPDYEMSGFSLQHYTQEGAPTSVLRGERMRHFPDTRTFEIEGVLLDWTDDVGRRTEARAAHAVASEDGREVELSGGARVRREPPPPGSATAAPGEPALEIRSEHLWVHTGLGQVRSDRPIELIQGDSTVRADRLRYDHSNGVLELEGAVRGTLAPAGAARAVDPAS